jgi:hypothetical protein
MPLPATVAHLDVDAVADVLINHHANIRNAARALNVPSGDLRKWVLLDERLSAAAVEAIELKLDVAEANLHEALGSEDPRRRDAVSMFFLRHMQRAAKRGYAVAALGVEANAEPAPRVRYTIRWANETQCEEIERDGWTISVPKYITGDHDPEAPLEGELTESAVMIGRQDAAVSEPAPVPAPMDEVAPTPDQIQLLKLRPDKAQAFDDKFGVGAAAKLLG